MKKISIIVTLIGILSMSLAYGQSSCDPIDLGLNRIELTSGEIYCGNITLLDTLVIIDPTHGWRKIFPIKSIVQIIETDNCNRHR